MDEEEALYYIAIDFNVIITVVKQIVEKPWKRLFFLHKISVK
jgi:hypothetical protein